MTTVSHPLFPFTLSGSYPPPIFFIVPLILGLGFTASFAWNNKCTHFTSVLIIFFHPLNQ
jgi:hypothetical protein